MQLIPVFDVKKGQLVQAVGGEREKYQPLESPFYPAGFRPVDFARFLKEKGLATIYLADLDAIMGRGHNLHLVADLVSQAGVELWVDMGLASPEQCSDLPELAGVKWILASETVPSLDSAGEMAGILGGSRVLFSIDLKGGQLLSPNDKIRTSGPFNLAAQLNRLGLSQFLVLELARVGTCRGPDLELVSRLCRELPGASFYPGGGIRHQSDLEDLARAGAAGVLVATALYQGRLPMLGDSWVAGRERGRNKD